MSAAKAAILVKEFMLRSGTSAFPNLGVTRAAFGLDLLKRITRPAEIDQGQASLCGPASFLFGIARSAPDLYASYVIRLYETGEATIGKLKVKAGRDCRGFVPATNINPVDWVALASLRDSENSVLDYDNSSVQVGGITMPGTLGSWFRQAGYATVENRTNLIFDKGLSTLLRAHQRLMSGEHVCLLLGANVLAGRPGGKATADHWVVLTTPISVAGQSGTALLAKGASVDKDETLLKGALRFSVFSWGQEPLAINSGFANLTVTEFLDYFYGFVSAK